MNANGDMMTAVNGRPRGQSARRFDPARLSPSRFGPTRFAVMATLVALCAMLLNASASAAPPTIRASLDRDHAAVGELIDVEITLEWDAAREAPRMEPGLRLGDFEVVDLESGPPRKVGEGRLRQTRRLRIAAFDPGARTLPPIAAEWAADAGSSAPRRLETPPLSVVIDNMEEVAGAEAPRDLKPVVPMEAGRPLWLWIASGIAALVVALGAWLIWRRRRLAGAGSAERVRPIRPAHEAALEALDALSRELPDTREEAERFYVRLSEIVRVFIGRRFGFDAMERTTSETITRLGDIAAFDDEWLGRARALLDACDLVKFARFPAARAEAVEAIEQARGLIQTHRADVAPATVGEDAPADPDPESDRTEPAPAISGEEAEQ